MRLFMRSPKQQTSDRQADAARPPSGGVKGERPVVEQKGVVTSMVDALEDILKWERASERALRVAAEAGTTDQDVSSN